MTRGLVIWSTILLLFVVAHQGEGRPLLPSNPVEATVPTSEGLHHVAASKPKPVPCNWVCGPENIYDCHCVPIIPPPSPSPVPCTWVCGQGKHLYECDCILDAPPPNHAETKIATNATSTSAAAQAGDLDKVDSAQVNKFDTAQVDKVEAAMVNVSVKGRRPVPCTWVCGQGNNNNYDCICVPDKSQQEANDIIDSAPTVAPAAAPAGVVRAGAPKPVPCTWVCGKGNHSYECQCIPLAAPFMDLGV